MKTRFQRDGVLTIIAVSVLSAGFIIGFYLPERRASESLRDEIAALKQSIREVPVRVAELESLKREVKTREEFLRKVDPWMPRDARVSSILENVTQLAKNAQLHVTRLEPKPAKPADSYRSMSFRITFHGNFAGIALFLKGLESHDRTVTFDEVSLKHGSDERSATTQADLHFSVFADGPDFDDSAGNDARGNVSAADTRIR